MTTGYGITNNAKGFPDLETYVQTMVSDRGHIIKAVKGDITISEVQENGRVVVSFTVEHTILKGDQKLKVQMNPETGWVFNVLVDSE